jgi:hypothetical protein
MASSSLIKLKMLLSSKLNQERVMATLKLLELKKLVKLLQINSALSTAQLTLTTSFLPSEHLGLFTTLSQSFASVETKF